jgi:hypothetical protein
VARESVIDLGLLGPVPERSPEGVRWRGPPLGRRAILGWLTTVLVVALVAGSGSPPVLPVSVPVPDGSRIEVVGDLLLVAAGGQEGGRSSLDWTAYDLSTGEPLWTLRRMGDRSGLVAADGLLWDGGFPLDPATGQWLSPKGSGVPSGYRYLGVPGEETLVVSGGYRPYSDSAVDVEFTYEVVGVDAQTGAVRWRDRPDPGVRVWLAGDPAVVVTISSDELVSVRDPDTGDVLASRQIPSATSAELVGDRLLVRVWEPGGEQLRAFARETMEQLWALPRPDGAVERCGQMLCVHTVPAASRTVLDGMSGDGWEVPRSTELIDPATGERAWVTEYRLYPVGNRFLAYDNEGALRMLLDARGGWALRDLTGWQAVVPPAGYGDRPALDSRGRQAVTLMRTDQSGDTRVARLDPATGQLTDLVRLPLRPVRCEPYRNGVVCLHDNRIWVWPL